MCSPRRIAANRANAQRSTGPRTATGKEKSRRNALKHGLAIPASADADWSYEVARLARLRAGEDRDNPRILKAAERVAEAFVSVIRIRHIRTTYFDIMFRNLNIINFALEMFEKGFVRLDRYERRALSGHRTAVRALNEERAALQNHTTEKLDEI